MEKNETEMLAYEIADRSAKVDISSYCFKRGSWWIAKASEEDLAAEHLLLGGDRHPEIEEEKQEDVDRAVRYLELRGKLKRHPDEPELVQVCEA